jgi:beta-xylosidase
MKEWFTLSSKDLVHWERKVALDLKAFAWAGSNAWAGQMVTKDGKFYWYVPVNERGSGMAIGVAVADSPEGPFKDAIGWSHVSL